MAKKAKSRGKKPAKKKAAREKAPAAKKKSVRNTAKRDRIERKLEEGLLETFPGSDPVAVTDPMTLDKRD